MNRLLQFLYTNLKSTKHKITKFSRKDLNIKVQNTKVQKSVSIYTENKI